MQFLLTATKHLLPALIGTLRAFGRFASACQPLSPFSPTPQTGHKNLDSLFLLLYPSSFLPIQSTRSDIPKRKTFVFRPIIPRVMSYNMLTNSPERGPRFKHISPMCHILVDYEFADHLHPLRTLSYRAKWTNISTSHHTSLTLQDLLSNKKTYQHQIRNYLSIPMMYSLLTICSSPHNSYPQSSIW